MYILQNALNLVYPQRCAACKILLCDYEQGICLKCFHALPFTQFHEQSNHELFSVFQHHPEIQGVNAYLFFTAKGKVQKMLHALKYGNRPLLGEQIGNWYASDLKSSPDYPGKINFIVPVPIHTKRHRKRGYNQSLCFASGLSDILSLPILKDLLIKKKYTESQTFKSREERRAATIHSIQISGPDRIIGKTVLLVDDVITTGATLEACAHILIQSGCHSIFISAIAYTRS